MKKSAAPPLPWSPEIAALEAKKRREVEDALTACSGNATAAATRLGIARSSLYKLLARFKLVERAKDLRLASGNRALGRQWKR